VQETNRIEFKRELGDRFEKAVASFLERQQMTLQSTLSPRQNLTFKQLCIYYEEKDL
jgi:hypothetical protein